MSATLLAKLRDTRDGIRETHHSCRRFYGDDGTRYPRDYQRPATALKIRSHARAELRRAAADRYR